MFSLRTHHRTTLYWDVPTQTLRHGVTGSVPRNVVLHVKNGAADLVYLTASGAVTGSVRHHPESNRFILAARDTQAPLQLQFASRNRISLMQEGCFLGAGIDGSIALDRPACGDQEVFALESAALPSPPVDVLHRSDPRSPPHPPAPSLAVLHRDPDGKLRRLRTTFTVIGVFASNWSLAMVNRRIAVALERADPGSVRLAPSDIPTFSEAGADAPMLVEIAGRPAPADGLHVVLYQRWPVMPPTLRGDLTLAYFFYEATHIPEDVVVALNLYDAVLVSAEFLRPALLRSGVTRPIVVIGFCPDLAPFEAVFAQRRSDPPPPRPFTFLHVSSHEMRKGVDLLAQAYAASFTHADHVRLVMRGHPNAVHHLEAMAARYPQMAPVTLIGDELSTPDLAALYRDADAMVLPTRGEGFNIPAAEAIAAGLDLIVTGFGGQMDFCANGAARLLAYRMEPSQGHFSTPGATWAVADLEDLSAAMREAASGLLHRSDLARDEVLELLRDSSWVHRVRDAVAALLIATIP